MAWLRRLQDCAAAGIWRNLWCWHSRLAWHCVLVLLKVQFVVLALSHRPGTHAPAPLRRCTTEYGRQYYLTIQFIVLAFLVGSQAVGSIFFIVMYYWRRMSWRFRNQKSKKRIARAAHDALGLKVRRWVRPPGYCWPLSTQCLPIAQQALAD